MNEPQMDERTFSFTVHYQLSRHRETPAAIGAKFLDTLDALSRIDPLFADWEVLDYPAMASLPLALARPRIAAIVENNVVRDKRNEPQPESGYKATGMTANVIRSRIVKFRVRAGGLTEDEMGLYVGDPLYPTDPLIVKYGLFREALLATSAIWRPLWAYVSAFRMYYWKGPIVPGAPVIRYNPFFITWIAYLSPKVARGLVIEPELRTESTPDGGLLMSATNEPLDLTNPEHLRRVGILAETMIARTGCKFPNDDPD
jgi:hypothetical protein